ncbi:DNA helicase [Tanacetum coccineum]|uniref:ATP-dependent DNA helicase n=1 Tax=Tanacetum coccineum TaxID=301880 RepID=A0ABQ5BRY7_9ASTR
MISTLRFEGKIVLASSCIASLLLPSGRTAHSRSKLPLELTEESISLDRSLRDILNALSSLFGGKSILLGGDFWQTLPVFTLGENMRLSRPDISADERCLVNLFASWLLDVGEGIAGQRDKEDPENTSWIDIPPSYCLHPMTKATMCPKNETADIINSKVLDMVNGERTTYVSQVEATPIGNDGANAEMLYPVEHLNTLKLPGFPPHQLELKVGAPVMLLRNVNLAGGLCNGTRMIVRQLMTKLI